MGLKEIILSMLVFSVVIIAGVYMLVDMQNNYPQLDLSNSTDGFGEVYNLSTSLNSTAQAMKGQVFATTVSGGTTTENDLFKGAFSALLSIPDLFKIVGDVLQNIAISIGVPPIFVGIGLTALVIIITFGIILLIFRING